jgi:hypothetical protein
MTTEAVYLFETPLRFNWAISARRGMIIFVFDALT